MLVNLVDFDQQDYIRGASGFYSLLLTVLAPPDSEQALTLLSLVSVSGVSVVYNDPFERREAKFANVLREKDRSSCHGEQILSTCIPWNRYPIQVATFQDLTV